MKLSAKLFTSAIVLSLILSACGGGAPTAINDPTAQINPTEDSSAKGTPTPATSQLGVEKEALRGVQVHVWHPWFGAEASLFESQVAQFNKENEWGIVISAESKENYNEMFVQTSAALDASSNPQVAISLPEHALAWGDDVLDLNPYVRDVDYGMTPLEVSEFSNAVWNQDVVDEKRFGMPAQRTARFILYNQTWARELGFDTPPNVSGEFEAQACAAHQALSKDEDPNNDALGGWLIDTHPITPLSWMFAFDGGAQAEDGYRFLSDGNTSAFKFLKALQQKNCAWVASPDLPVNQRFAMRQALFITAALEDLPNQERAFAAATSRDEWIVLPFPGEEQTAIVLYGSSFIAFESDDTTQLASWLFIRWMLSADTQADWVRSTGLFPLRSSTFDLLADYSADHPQWAGAVEYLTIAKTTPKLASWRVVRVMLGDAFADMFDTIRHPDLTEGQVSAVLAEMDTVAGELK